MTSIVNNAHLEADKDAIDDSVKGKYIFRPRGLDITWGNDDRYWRITGDPNNKKGEVAVAELVQVSWLEVKGTTPCAVTPGNTYKVSFRISFEPHAFGWDGAKVFVMAKIGKKGNYSWTHVFFNDKMINTEPYTIPENGFKIKVEQPVNSLSDDDKLYFGLYEVWSGTWKGGLKIHNALVEVVG